MAENKLLTKVQNYIDIIEADIEEMKNNEFYGSTSDLREIDCLENIADDLRDMIKGEQHENS